MGRTDDPSTTSRQADGRATATARVEDSGEAASRSQIARRLHRIILVGLPVMVCFALRSGVRLDRPSAVTVGLPWLPILVWGAFTRTRRVRTHALLVIIPTFAIAVVSLIDMGHSPGATGALLSTIVLVGLFFGRRAAYGATVLVVVTFVAIGVGFGAGWLAPPDMSLSDITRPLVWVRAAVALATIGFVLVSAVTTLIRRYERSLEETRSALRELHAEQERRQREAREAVQKRDDFLLIASHELRTPLTPLLLEVQGLERRARRGDLSAAGAELSAPLRKTVVHVQRLVRLVDDLVGVSQLLAEQIAIHREAVDLAAVVRGVADRLAVPLARSGSALALHAPPECVGQWDRARLDQMVTNLLGNAIKYGAGKPIELSLEATPETATLMVRDHGIGIEDGAHERIFGRFERAVPSQHYGGFGVGLWLVKQILDALDGRVQLHSAPGAGSTFIIALPRGAPVASRPELRVPDQLRRRAPTEHAGSELR